MIKADKNTSIDWFALMRDGERWEIDDMEHWACFLKRRAGSMAKLWLEIIKD